MASGHRSSLEPATRARTAPSARSWSSGFDLTSTTALGAPALMTAESFDLREAKSQATSEQRSPKFSRPGNPADSCVSSIRCWLAASRPPNDNPFIVPLLFAHEERSTCRNTQPMGFCASGEGHVKLDSTQTWTSHWRRGESADACVETRRGDGHVNRDLEQVRTRSPSAGLRLALPLPPPLAGTLPSRYEAPEPDSYAG